MWQIWAGISVDSALCRDVNPYGGNHTTLTFLRVIIACRIIITVSCLCLAGAHSVLEDETTEGILFHFLISLLFVHGD